MNKNQTNKSKSCSSFQQIPIHLPKILPNTSTGSNLKTNNKKQTASRVELTSWRLSHSNIKLLVPILHPTNAGRTPTVRPSIRHGTTIHLLRILTSSRESNQRNPPKNVSPTIKRLGELIFAVAVRIRRLFLPAFTVTGGGLPFKKSIEIAVD